MKKSIFMIIAILTTGCAASFAGCAKNSDDNTTVYREETERRITLTDDTTDDNAPDTAPDGDNTPDRECPDGNCGHKGPHAKHGKKRKQPAGGKFRFIIELGPHCGHGKCHPEHEAPDAPETLPAPDNGENN